MPSRRPAARVDRTQAPRLGDVLANTRTRVLGVEQRTDTRARSTGLGSITGDTNGIDLPFTFVDQIMAVDSNPWTPVRGSVRLRRLTLILGAAGTTSTVGRARLNGTLTGATLTLAAAATSTEADFEIDIAPGDILRVAITTAGTGALDLTAIASLYDTA